MIKAIPVLIVIVSIVLPIYFATRPNPPKSLRLLQMMIIAFALLWAMLCLHVYPKFVFAD